MEDPVNSACTHDQTCNTFHNVDNHQQQGTENKRLPLGLSSFNRDEQRQFGENVRLSMALIEGAVTPAPAPSPEKAMPDHATSILRRLKSLTHDITCAQADQLELLVRFDELQGWKPSGARHCVDWMNLELGISQKTAWEYLRVGRHLRERPIITALFRAGRLTWSKVPMRIMKQAYAMRLWMRPYRK
jgi:hypothetical protein